MNGGGIRGLAGLLARRRWWVAAAWLAVVLLAAPLAARQTEHLTGGGFDVPGSESAAAGQVTEEHFREGDGIVVLLRAERDATAAERAAAIARTRRAIAGVGDLALPPAVVRRGRVELERSGTAIMRVRGGASTDALVDSASTLRSRVAAGVARDGVTTYLLGQPAVVAEIQELSKQDLSEAEKGGFPIVALILLAVFGSLAAAALPLAFGFVAVTITGALIYLISLQMEMSIFVTNVASMIGIGVAIDYSLFVLVRYREERERGRDKGEARAEALATSGLAVVFSGLAVIVSIAGVWMVDSQVLRSMALGAMIVVATSILTAVTLLPALIAILGDRVLPGGVVARALGALRRLRRRPRGAAERDGFWKRWTAVVMARPWFAVLGVSAVMLTLAIPLLSLTMTTEALRQFPAHSDVRVGTALAAEQVGGGIDPIQVVADFDGGGSPDRAERAALAGFVRRLRATPGVSAVAPPVTASGNALIRVTPRGPSESDATAGLVGRIRDEVVPASALGRLAVVQVGGEPARMLDLRELIGGSMWKIVLFVLALSFVILMMTLRSLLLPLKAVLMNLLSIAAAFGVVVAIFQWGWLDGFLGFESLGSVDTLNVPLIFVVVFGLSMDYEVFLLSRIRERYLEHGDNERAVAEGLSSSARTISSAALIMTAVFAVFALTGVITVKELGVGCAIAIALDATLVRLILVPGAMKLMGEWNWWMPTWLDRLLPALSFETPEAPAAIGAAEKSS